MTMISASAAATAAAPLPLRSIPEPGAAIFAAASLLLPHLESGERVDAAALRAAMETAFDASDATGAWDWKTAYDACEAATVLFLRKYGRAVLRKATSPASRLAALTKIASLLPTHTRRSEETQTFQQFSTPIPLGLAALTAASPSAADRVLEPSAGTGLLAILAEVAGAGLILNELMETRANLLASLFPAISVTRFDAAQIDDHLDRVAIPSVVIMNPPFSVMANVSGRVADAAYRHLASALARLAPGGRLVTITGANFSPAAPAWRESFVRLQERGRVSFTAAIAGSVYAKARHDDRDAPDRHRQDAGRRRPTLPGFRRCRARCRDAASLDRTVCPRPDARRVSRGRDRDRTEPGARLSRPIHIPCPRPSHRPAGRHAARL